jgi:hypothetical protein
MKKENNYSYLYVGIHYDLFNDREIGINDKKVGETITPEIREGQLSKTKSPIVVLFVKLYKFVGGQTAQIVEKNILHPLLSTRNSVGEWFTDDDDRLISDINKALSGLSSLGIKYEEVALENGKISSNKKEVIKKNNSRIYREYDNIKSTDEDDRYSLWVLSTPQGESLPIIYDCKSSTISRIGKKKATENNVINYCNSSKFLELVNFDYTKITAQLITSSNNKEDIDNKEKELKK